MRVFLSLILLFLSTALIGQNLESIQINESFNNASLNKVIRKLKNKYDVRISYDDALISGVKISGQFNNINLSDFLSRILTSQGIEYKLINGNIVLVPKEVDLNISSPSLFDITVFGVVRDAMTGENLPNALVRVDGNNKGTISNKDGYFSLVGVPTDTSTIEVRYLGYQKSQVKLKRGQSKQTMQILMVESAVELADFEVVDRVNKTVSYGDDISQMTINPKNLASLPSLGELDVFRSLQFLPGISGTNETSSALSIRNSPSSHNLVLLDGFTIYRLDHFFGVFSAINANAIRDIQVYKGGFGSQYGNRVSGVVDMKGNTGNFNQPNFSLGINLLSARFSANLPLGQGRGALHFSYRRAYTDIIRTNLFEKLYSNYRAQSNQVLNQQASDDFLRPDFSFYDLNLKTSYKLSQRDIISLSIYNGRDNLDTNYDIVETNPDDPTEILRVNSFMENAQWGNRGIGLNWSRNWSANHYSYLQVGQSDHFFDYQYEDSGLNGDGDLIRYYKLTRNNDVKDLQVNFVNEIQLKRNHQLKIGLNYSNLQVENRAIIQDLEGEDTAENPPNNNGNVAAIYFEDQIRISNKLSLKPGIRYNYTDLTSENYLVPRLALSYKLSPTVEFKAAAGQYIQLIKEIIFDDPLSNAQGGYFLASDMGNDPSMPSIDVLKSNHLIAGFQYKKEGLIIDLEYYHKENEGINEILVSHLVDRNTNIRSPEILYTQGTGTINGIDFLIQKEKGNYTGWLAYTYSRANNQINDINNGELMPSRLDQRHEVKFVHLLDLPKWNLSATWVFGSGRPFLEPEVNLITDNSGNLINYEVVNTSKTITRLPAYHRLDLSAALKFGNKEVKGEIGLSLLNVYNRGNIQGKRLKTNELDDVINGVPGAEMPTDLYREVLLLDFTPSLFLNLNF